MADDDGATAVATPVTNGTTAANPNGVEIDWRTYAPDDVKGDLKSLESVKDLPALIKTAVHGQKALGSAIRLPAPNAKPEEIAKAKTETMAKLKAAGLIDGAPEKPEDYKYQRPEAALSGGWDEQAEQAFVAEAHKAGLTGPQLQAVLNWYGGFVGGVQNRLQGEAREVEGKLRQEWGPNYDANLGRANRLMSEVEAAAPGFIDLFTQTGVGRHPIGVKGLVWLAEQMVEHGAMDGTGHTGMGAADAQARMDEMFADKNHPYNQRTHPDHGAAIDEFLQLSKIANRR